MRASATSGVRNRDVAPRDTAVPGPAVTRSDEEASRGDAAGGTEDRTEADEPRELARHGRPRSRIVERGGEVAHGMHERQPVADPPRDRRDLLRNEAEEDDRHHDEHRDE